MMEEEISEVCSVHTMKYHSALKEILIQVMIRSLNDIVLREIRQILCGSTYMRTWSRQTHRDTK